MCLRFRCLSESSHRLPNSFQILLLFSHIRYKSSHSCYVLHLRYFLNYGQNVDLNMTRLSSEYVMLLVGKINRFSKRMIFYNLFLKRCTMNAWCYCKFFDEMSLTYRRKRWGTDEGKLFKNSFTSAWTPASHFRPVIVCSYVWTTQKRIEITSLWWLWTYQLICVQLATYRSNIWNPILTSS